MLKEINSFLNTVKNENNFRELRDVVPLSERECLLNGIKYINFSSNNYLGLTHHPKVLERSMEWGKLYGVGTAASRLVTGTISQYSKLEEKIADWKGMQAALLYGSGYLANIGVISTIADRKTVVFADKLNHASLNNGCLSANAKFIRYRHNDMNHLSALLEKYPQCKKIIISDTIFSMDGDIAPINELESIAKESCSFLYLDDAHGTGVFGDCGEGLVGTHQADILMGTFSKAMGCYGAYVATSTDIKEYLINKSPTFIFTTSLPPMVCGAIDAAVDLVRSNEFKEKRTEFLIRIEKLIDDIKSLGFNVGDTHTPIIPIILGSSELVLKASEFLRDRGVYAVGIRPPTVPKGTARLRVSLSMAHTKEDLDILLDSLADLKRNLL